MTAIPDYIVWVLGILTTFLSAYFWYDRNSIQKRMETTELNFNDAFDKFAKSILNLQIKIQNIQLLLAANRALSSSVQRPTKDCQTYIKESVQHNRLELLKLVRYAVMDALRLYSVK